jgi:ATP-binding cassette, subfamily B, bacterial MsbA
MFEYLKRIAFFAKNYKEPFLFAILFNALYSVFAVFSMLALIPILKILFDKNLKTVTELPTISGNFNAKIYFYDFIYFLIHNIGAAKVLGLVCVLGFFLFFLRNFFRYMGEYYLVSLKTGFSTEIRKAIFQKILHLPTAFYNTHTKGDLMVRITNDTAVLESTYLGSIITVLRAPISILFPIIAMFTISIKLSLFTFLVLPIMGSVIALTGKRLKSMSAKAMDYSSKNNGIIDETLTSHKIIKIFRAEKLRSSQFNQLTDEARKLIRRYSRIYELASPTSELIGSLGILLLMWYGGRLIIEDNNDFLEGETFIFFLTLFYQVIEPAKTLIIALNGINTTRVNAQRVFELIDANIEIIDNPNAKKIDGFYDEIAFNQVGFQYNQENKLFENVNLTIKKGEIVALVGASGGGKSSISSLLARYYDVQKGSITLDGEDIRNISLHSYRGLIGMVTQEPLLFNDTIKNNILLGRPNASFNQVIEAAKVAFAHDFIMQLPQAYETHIGDAGNMLSGGQKQRISIARAVLTNPELLILDEATSSLDSESEKAVQIALESVMLNRTSVVIAHRLATIQKANKILVFDRGQIIEQGTHASLIAQNGKYAQLVKLQELGVGFE